jgi:RHH-type transcriptional regulator, proline utilization regulon repressor / proline dehydrogenase / delta 1-pyrroline-5-carboxylate dehydrogenase
MATAMDRIERETTKLGRALYQKAAEHKPALFEAQDLLGRMIGWSLDDDSLRVALFRFVDVLPSLESSSAIGRHLEEYFARVDHALGGLAILAQAMHAGTLVAPIVRRNVIKLARRFIADESGDHLINVLSSLRKEPAAFTLDVVGEATVSEREAEAMQQRYLELLRRLAKVSEAWPTRPQVDEGPAGAIPRVNLSVKLSSLCARFDPLDPNTEEIVGARLRQLLREAARLGAAVTVDMEQYSFKDLTLAMFRSVLEEPEFHKQPYAAIALQAYLKECEKDAGELIRWARRHGRRIGVRLVKGAYWDSEIAWAKQKNWPIPVFLDKAETDASYEGLSRLLLESRDVIDAAFGSHNLRSLAQAIVAAKELGVPVNGYEIQMLYGMAEPVRRAIIENGQRVRVYLPVGELLPGISYLIRRLMENTSNTSFLRQTYADKKDMASLLKSPTLAAMPLASLAGEPRGFATNRPSTFPAGTIASAFGKRWRKSAASSAARGDAAATGWSRSTLPIRTRSSVECAWRRWTKLRKPSTGPFGLHPTGAIRRRQSERRSCLPPPILCASGAGSWRRGRSSKSARAGAKPMPMLPRRSITWIITPARCCAWPSRARPKSFPAKSIFTRTRPRGVAAIIAPWNFPLAILTGMTAAALVSGNCALMKPAEQSPLMAAHLLDILRKAGMSRTTPASCFRAAAISARISFVRRRFISSHLPARARWAWKFSGRPTRTGPVRST